MSKYICEKEATRQELIEELERLQKENEELQQEKIDNIKMISLAQNSMLDYEKGYEDGKNQRMNAVQSIVENQQYYIIQRQMEKYQNHIDRLKKENKKLLENSIPKEKIENLINSLKNDIVNTKIKMEKERYIDYIRKARLKAFNTKMNEIIDKLQELLEGGIK